MSSAGRSAVLRAARRFESASTPPILSFSVTNSSGVIAPARSAFRPYWTPTLSPVCKARVLPGAIGVAATGSGRIGHRVVDERGRQPTIVAWHANRRDRARRLVDDQGRHVIARLVV